MYQINYTNKAFRQLKKLDRNIQKRILSVIERARIRPYRYVEDIKTNSYFRLRAGDFRIINDIKNKELVILVIEIVKRDRIYR